MVTKKKTLALREIPEGGVKGLLANKEFLAPCDIAVFVYDSFILADSNENSWRKSMELLVDIASHGEVTGFEVPCLVVPTKDDLDPSPMAVQDSTRLHVEARVESTTGKFGVIHFDVHSAIREELVSIFKISYVDEEGDVYPSAMSACGARASVMQFESLQKLLKYVQIGNMNLKGFDPVCRVMGIEAPIPVSMKLGDSNNVFGRIISAAQSPHWSVPETEAGKTRKQYWQFVNRSMMVLSVAIAGMAAYRMYAARRNCRAHTQVEQTTVPDFCVVLEFIWKDTVMLELTNDMFQENKNTRSVLQKKQKCCRAKHILVWKQFCGINGSPMAIAKTTFLMIRNPMEGKENRYYAEFSPSDSCDLDREILTVYCPSSTAFQLFVAGRTMFLLRWIYGVLASLGLWQKEAKILFLGLDNADKTTLLHSKTRFSLSVCFGAVADFFFFFLFHFMQRLIQHQPTQYPTLEELSIEKIKFKAFDSSGHQIARRVWKDYYAKVNAVVCLVDAFDKERFAESKRELDALLSDEALINVPLLILGNKIDITFAASEDELRYHLGISNFTTGKGKVNLIDSNVQLLELFMCSIVHKMGYGDGFKWLS
ncbi:hypothetical protein ACLOJK_016621 [Asimina triloba]